MERVSIASNIDVSLFDCIEAQLKVQPPGKQAQNQMAPQGRELMGFDHKHSAAVLIALYPAPNDLIFPLIERVQDGYVHGGQIGLPGGRMEKGESTVETALREAWEEVGILEHRIRILGELSPLEIPVSSFLVYPVIGCLESEPDWNINHLEVEALIKTRIFDLLDPVNRKSEMRRTGRGQLYTPYFDLYNYKVWGATAMMLSEFRVLLRTCIKSS